MAATGYYDQDGNWVDPTEADYAGGTGNPQDPYAPPGYSSPAPDPGVVDPTSTTAPTTPTTTPPPTAPAPGGFGQFNGSFSAPGWIDNPDAPQPDLPTFTPPPAFHFNAPTPESIKSNPGYTFRRDQGLDALQRWAAYKGVVNDSGTADALIDYAGNSASQEYDNIYNRDWTTQRGEYDTNYNTQYVDPYKFSYQRGLDLNAPRIQSWQANTAANADRNHLASEHAWADFMRQYDQWKTNVGNDLAG